MRCIAIALALLGGLAIGYFARSLMSGFHRGDTHEADLAAITKLEQEDIEVARLLGRG